MPKKSRKTEPAQPADRKGVTILGVSMDLGQARRGVDMGPSAFRYSGLVEKLRGLGLAVRDEGDLDAGYPEGGLAGRTRLRYMKEIISVCEELSEKCWQVLDRGEMPIVLGGDHSIAMGTMAGVSRYAVDQGGRLGLIWFDAHGDLNTDRTTPSGNIHGMPLAAILGSGARPLVEIGVVAPKADPAQTVMIGVRDLDPGEREFLATSGVRAFTMKEIDRMGISEVVNRALETATRGTLGFHLSFDLDGLDPAIAPGVGTPVRGGLGYREAHLMMEMIADSKKLLSMEVVELNPILDIKNMTGELGVELILSALGKTII